MRIGLIAALARADDGGLRAHLPLAGQSVLAWQVAVLRRLGAERIICLSDTVAGEVLRLQQAVEAGGGSFHVLKGFAALPALVRAEDDLIVLRDGLVPDPAHVARILPSETVLARSVLCLPADHPLAMAHPAQFERIDAARHWAGMLVMRGAPVQQLADFPEDADATSVLLRFALQAGTPCRVLTIEDVTAATWWIAESAAAARRHEAALIAATAPPRDWRAPLTAIGAVLVQKTAHRWIGQGSTISAGLALVMLLGGVLAAAWWAPAAGLALAATGAFTARVAAGFSAVAKQLRHYGDNRSESAVVAITVDLFAALTAWFALAPWPEFTPLAICGPLAIGLARLAERDGRGALRVAASDRASLLLVLSLGAALGFPAYAAALAAAALLAALLLNPSAT